METYYQRNRERIRARYLANPRQWWINYLRHKYGLEIVDFDRMLQEQDGRCDICNLQMLDPQIDHDHKTGKVRGLLCRSCNALIAAFEMPDDWKSSVVAYFRKARDAH
jgi:hypothetical protein